MGRRYDLMGRKKRSFMPLIILMLLLLTAVGVWYYYQQPQEQTAGTTTKELAIPNISKALPINIEKKFDKNPNLKLQNKSDGISSVDESGKPKAEAKKSEMLPTLENSDGYVRARVSSLFPGFDQWLANNNIIRKSLLIINDFAQGQRLFKHMRWFRMSRQFKAEQDELGLFISSLSYRRYDMFAKTIDSANVNAVIDFYKEVRPLYMEVFKEFDYPDDYTLEDIIKKAVGEILSAPVIETRIGLIRTSVNYKFADKKIENMNPVHKQMIRMGPKNTRIIQNKFRLFLEALLEQET